VWRVRCEFGVCGARAGACGQKAAARAPLLQLHGRSQARAVASSDTAVRLRIMHGRPTCNKQQDRVSGAPLLRSTAGDGCSGCSVPPVHEVSSRISMPIAHAHRAAVGVALNLQSRSPLPTDRHRRRPPHLARPQCLYPVPCLAQHSAPSCPTQRSSSGRSNQAQRLGAQEDGGAIKHSF